MRALHQRVFGEGCLVRCSSRDTRDGGARATPAIAPTKSRRANRAVPGRACLDAAVRTHSFGPAQRCKQSDRRVDCAASSVNISGNVRVIVFSDRVPVHHVECRVIIGQWVLSVGKALRVMERRYMGSTCLMGRAEQSLSPLFSNAGDLNTAGYHGPRINRLTSGSRPHNVESCRRCLPRIEAMLASQCRVLFCGECGEVSGDAVMLPGM